MKYLPKEADPVDASRWIHDDLVMVQEFLHMLSVNGMRYTFESEDMASWDVEIHVFRQGNTEEPDAIVATGRWLIIHANDVLETMNNQAFIDNYRLA